jgi:hypothetical protein
MRVKLPILKGNDNLIISFGSPILFIRVECNWRIRFTGYKAVLFRMPRISFYWGSYDSDF